MFAFIYLFILYFYIYIYITLLFIHMHVYVLCFAYICMCMCTCALAHICTGVYTWRPENNLQKLVLSFNHVGPGDPAEVGRPGGIIYRVSSLVLVFCCCCLLVLFLFLLKWGFMQPKLDSDPLCS